MMQSWIETFLSWYGSQTEQALMVLFTALFASIFLILLTVWLINVFRSGSQTGKPSSKPFVAPEQPRARRKGFKTGLAASSASVATEMGAHSPEQSHEEANLEETNLEEIKPSPLKPAGLRDRHEDGNNTVDQDDSYSHDMTTELPDELHELKPAQATNVLATHAKPEVLSSQSLERDPNGTSERAEVDSEPHSDMKPPESRLLVTGSEPLKRSHRSQNGVQAAAQRSHGRTNEQDALAQQRAHARQPSRVNGTCQSPMQDDPALSINQPSLNQLGLGEQSAYTLTSLLDKAQAKKARGNITLRGFSVRGEYRKLSELKKNLTKQFPHLAPHDVWPLLLAESLMWIQELGQIIGYGNKQRQAEKALLKGEFDTWIRLVQTIKQAYQSNGQAASASHFKQIRFIEHLSGFLFEPEKMQQSWIKAMHEYWGDAQGWVLLTNMCYQSGELENTCRVAECLFRATGSVDAEVLALTRGNVGYSLLQTGAYPQAHQQLQAALSKLTEVNEKVDVSHSLNNLGMCSFLAGNFAEAEVMIKRSIEINLALGRKKDVAAQKVNLGIICYKQGDLQSALSLHSQSLAIEQELGDNQRIAGDYSNLGKILREMGDPQQAAVNFNKALNLFVTLDDALGEADAVSNIGMTHQDLGDLNEAERCFIRSLELRERQGDLYGIANDLTNLAKNAFRQGQMDRAKQLFEQSIELFRKENDPKGVAEQYRKLGAFERERGRLQEAESCYRHALQQVHLNADSTEVIDDLLRLASIASMRRNYEMAMDYLLRAVKYARRDQQVVHEAKIQSEMGKVALRQGNANAAEEAFVASMKIYQNENDTPAVIQQYGNQVLAQYLNGHESQLAQTLGTIKRLCHQHHLDSLYSDAVRRLGCFMQERGDLKSAIKYINHSMSIEDRLLRFKQQAMCLSRLGMLYREQHDYHKSIEAFTKSLSINEREKNQPGILNNLYQLAETASLANLPEKADRYYHQCAELLGSLGRVDDQAKVMQRARNTVSRSHHASSA